MKKVLVKDKLEVGKWYKLVGDKEWKFNDLICVKEVEGEKVRFYGFEEGVWTDSDWFNIGWNYIPATKEEVEEALIKEAKKRGFKEKKSFIGMTNEELIIIKDEKLWGYDEDFNILWNGEYGKIFNNGKWAEIVEETKEITIEQLQKELGYKIKIVE